jgi:spore germination protein YaaH
MAYLYHYPSGDPGPLAPPEWVSEVARFAASQIPPEKLSIALTMNGCDWGVPGQGKSMNYDKVMNLLAKYHAVVERDRDTATPFFRYTAKGVEHEVWFEDAVSLKEKARTLQGIGIHHVALWYLGSGDPAFLKDLTLP